MYGNVYTNIESLHVADTIFLNVDCGYIALWMNGSGAGAALTFYSVPEPEPEPKWLPGAGAGARAVPKFNGSASLSRCHRF